MRAGGACLHYFDAHAPTGALDRIDGGLDIEAVEIGHLDPGDLLHLLQSDAADLVLIRLGRALGEIDGAFHQDGDGRRLGDEGEGSVGEDGDHHGDDQTFLVLAAGLRVEGLAELHDVDALRAERGADRGRGRRLARRNLQLYDCVYFLRHFSES